MKNKVPTLQTALRCPFNRPGSLETIEYHAKKYMGMHWKPQQWHRDRNTVYYQDYIKWTNQYQTNVLN